MCSESNCALRLTTCRQDDTRFSTFNNNNNNNSAHFTFDKSSSSKMRAKRLRNASNPLQSMFNPTIE